MEKEERIISDQEMDVNTVERLKSGEPWQNLGKCILERKSPLKADYTEDCLECPVRLLCLLDAIKNYLEQTELSVTKGNHLPIAASLTPEIRHSLSRENEYQ